MKWYFASNDRSPDFFPLIHAAVNSALENTSLEPHFVYDGEENELCSWLSQKGVKIIRHRVSFYDALEKYYNEKLLNVASGTFLRCDIPILELEEEFILYTDCDVLFLKEFQSPTKPDYFACAPQFSKWNYHDFNAGVMLMNVKKMRESHREFIEYIQKNISSFQAFDQTAYQTFYGRKASRLPVGFNHKPYWGVAENAFIVHFHGAKPMDFANENKLKNLPYMHTKLYRKNPSAYDFYLKYFKEYYPDIEYCKDEILKLKNGEYPLVKQKGTPLYKKIYSRVEKIFLRFVNKFNK